MSGTIKSIKSVGVLAMIVTGLLAGPAMAAEQGVNVVRGTADGAAAAKSVAGLPTVIRGWAPGAPRPQPEPEPEPRGSEWITIGGDTLWLVERGGQQIIGCWLQGSTQVDGIDIRCGGMQPN